MPDTQVGHKAQIQAEKLDNYSNGVHAFSVHGHFYQPPREDPFTGKIPQEEGAAPHPNWNVRIHRDCYQPNAKLGNYGRMSFNFGPTLLSWIEKHDPHTYSQIISQDTKNVEKYGVGNAIAQAYNHTILPLASRADKITQVKWGIDDFVHRFGRSPRGMWLPETAVDEETLEILVDHGIEFTILAPWQADHEEIDPTEPYFVPLPSGRRIAVFFFHRELSAGVSFNGELTTNADRFALQKLMPNYIGGKTIRGEPQILLIASDGEVYGHHFAFRDWFLAYLTGGAGAPLGIENTFPALWLEAYSPRLETQIKDNTSWSCHHGVTRWSGDCACTTGGGKWKFSLRQALDLLGARIDDVYKLEMNNIGVDPWDLRNRYIQVILGEMTTAELLAQFNGHKYSNEKIELVRLLLEAQFERQRMFTSCGWFFEDFDRIEPQNNVAFAARAVWMIKQATGVDLENYAKGLLKFVVSRRSNVRGDQVFAKYI